MVQSYVKATNIKTPFNDGRPGPDWMLLFEHRHAVILTRRKPELLTLARAEGLILFTVYFYRYFSIFYVCIDICCHYMVPEIMKI